MWQTEAKYTGSQIDLLLDLFFRDHPRPMPWPHIARAMGVLATPKALDRLLWGVVTGYPGHDAHGPRREYAPTGPRVCRAGRAWLQREDRLLREALAGEGQLRQPPCDVAHVADVLARPAAEVTARWIELNADRLGREGFFHERATTRS
ncbi:hypothetical protein KKH23_04945 [Patescibacteria group bacterium]|nr:hypothetical protein [Patescibacteria group bacterium]